MPEDDADAGSAPLFVAVDVQNAFRRNFGPFADIVTEYSKINPSRPAVTLDAQAKLAKVLCPSVRAGQLPTPRWVR